jgi:hypothetical protein
MFRHGFILYTWVPKKGGIVGRGKAKINEASIGSRIRDTWS